jgi:hypothetical protein
MDLLVRFVVGGLVVSLFAALGDGLKPKSFAGLMGAAPSVALATVTLTVLKKGHAYAASEAESMILGGIAFLFYAFVVARTLMRAEWPVLPTTATALLLWLGVALGEWYIVLR